MLKRVQHDTKKFMEKILQINEAIKTAQKLREQGKSVVLAGGAFDILHPGHVIFLKKAKEKGDFLFIILENDKSLEEKKGKKRPINNQGERALVLSAIEFVDYIILLPNKFLDKDYDHLALSIKPAIIATTKDDPERIHKERQAKLTNARVVDVTDRILSHSTTKLIKYLEQL